MHQVQAVLLEWHQKFNEQQVNYDEILFYACHQLKLEKLFQTICASSPIVKDIQSMKSMFLSAFEQLNILLIKYIPGKPDTKWCTLLSLLQEQKPLINYSYTAFLASSLQVIMKNKLC